MRYADGVWFSIYENANGLSMVECSCGWNASLRWRPFIWDLHYDRKHLGAVVFR